MYMYVFQLLFLIIDILLQNYNSVRLDGWGGRIDSVITCSAWKKLHSVASIEGLVAIGHDNNHVSLSLLSNPLSRCNHSSIVSVQLCYKQQESEYS